MISITLYAAILLLVRIVSMTFITLVLKRQWALLKLPIKNAEQYNVKALKHFRIVLFTIVLVIFIGNLVPAIIDIATILQANTGRPDTVNPVSLIYTLTASVTSLISSYLIWRLYRLAADEKDITDLTVKRLKDQIKSNK